jgi:hypothetical protein
MYILARKDDVAAIGQCTFGQRLECAPSHDDGMSCSQRLEMQQVGSQVIEEVVVQTYRIIFGDADDDGYHI